jgi:hypothetical protein
LQEFLRFKKKSTRRSKKVKRNTNHKREIVIEVEGAGIEN